MQFLLLGASLVSALCCCKSGACSGSKPGQVGWPADAEWSKGRCCMDFNQAKCPWQNALNSGLPNPLAPTAYSMPSEGSCDVEASKAAMLLGPLAVRSKVVRQSGVAPQDSSVGADGHVATEARALPDGWFEYTDDETGKPYYYDGTNVQWEFPKAAKAAGGAVAGSLPAGLPLLFGAPLALTGCRCELPYCEVKGNGSHKKVYGKFPEPEQCDLSTITVIVMSLRDAPGDQLYEHIGRAKGMNPAKNGKQIQTGDVVGIFPESILASGQDAILANSLLPHDAAFIFAADQKAYGISAANSASRHRPGLVGGTVLEFTPALVGPQVFGQLEALVAGHEDLQHCVFFRAEPPAAGASDPRAWNELQQRDKERLEALAHYGAEEKTGDMARLFFRREQNKPAPAQVCTHPLYHANPRICLKERACTWSQADQRCALRSGL